MKKTKKTMYTAALLSAAVALQSEIGIHNVPASEEMSSVPVYGPPSYFYRDVRGDLNKDSKTDIVDYILMKSNAEKGTKLTFDEEMLSDLNEDNVFTSADIRIFEKYLFGKIPSVKGGVYSDDYDDNPSVLPSPSPTPIVTQPVAPYPIPQPAYGAPDASEPAATEPEKSSESEEMQTKYGPPAGYIYDDPDEPELNVTPEPMPTVYGPPPGYIYRDPDEPQLNDTPSVVYGPPSWFENEK